MFGSVACGGAEATLAQGMSPWPPAVPTDVAPHDLVRREPLNRNKMLAGSYRLQSTLCAGCDEIDEDDLTDYVRANDKAAREKKKVRLRAQC